ncbi:MAG: hypothetical protein JRG92_02560 [Deltaproteobacteria bacterium]|nr:hypothetical protein [Deltaproteobacteria bacterium]MBW2694964.1 hypothetical protein [Deltaproteobacteria bacterium]
MSEIEAQGGMIAARGPCAILSTAIASVTLALFFFGFGAVGTSLATDLPLVLTNDSIGMSAEEIDEVQGPDDFKDLDADGPDAFPAEEGDDGILKLTQDDIDWASQPQAEASAEQMSEFTSVEGPVAGESAPVDEPALAEPVPAEDTVGIASYAQCVEAAIRGGQGFHESSGVCRVLFPAEAAPAI